MINYPFIYPFIIHAIPIYFYLLKDYIGDPDEIGKCQENVKVEKENVEIRRWLHVPLKFYRPGPLTLFWL